MARGRRFRTGAGAAAASPAGTATAGDYLYAETAEQVHSSIPVVSRLMDLLHQEALLAKMFIIQTYIPQWYNGCLGQINDMSISDWLRYEIKEKWKEGEAWGEGFLEFLSRKFRVRDVYLCRAICLACYGDEI